MDNLILIVTILLIHFLAWLTPGPNVVMIIRNSLVYSRKSGIWTALGIAISIFIHIVFSIIAIFFLRGIATEFLSIIKFLGVGYLTYLGFKTFFMKAEMSKDDIIVANSKDIAPIHAIKIGFLTSIFNPKSQPFFISIFGSVIASGAPFWVVVVLWILMSFNGFIMASLISIFFSQKKIRSVYVNYQQTVHRILGTVLLVLAILLIGY
ncbi:MAG TPA: LysE family translocator [Patescibacteria group bacterium]|nr:LysE family translocator [Patescibacteria group bacterium]